MPTTKEKKFFNLRTEIWVCFFLVITTLAAYWQVHDFKFLSFDDFLYVKANPMVQSGLNRSSVVWAFTGATENTGYWVPITWLSFILEFEIWGLDAGGYHLTNVLLHILNALLIFYILKSMTGGLWQSAFVSALFALHPLHVESVAWVTERKDVLSAFFWILTMGAYYRYVVNRTTWKYLLVLLLFCLGLMAKPMLVTLPFVLLLLDYWPLKRLTILTWDKHHLKQQWPIIRRLVGEKVPFFILLIFASVAAFLTQKSIGAIHSEGLYSLDARLTNVPLAYLFYISKMFWPVNLALPYVHPGVLPLWQPVVALSALSTGTYFILKYYKNYPYLTVGWFWYLGTLFPVSGIVAIGDYAVADRYSYIPHIGLYLMIAWGAADLVNRWHQLGKIIIVAISIVLLLLMSLTRQQVALWKDDMTLFTHTLKINEKNWLALIFVGDAFRTAGQFDKAAEIFRKSRELAPLSLIVHYKYGYLMMEQKNWQESLASFTNALELAPEFDELHGLMAYDLQQLGKTQEAERLYLKALQLNSSSVSTLIKMGQFLAELGRNNEAIEYFDKVLKIDPGNENTLLALGKIFEKVGALEKAESHYQEVLKRNPKSAAAYTSLGVLMASRGEMNEAAQYFAKALEIAPQNSEALNNMGNILKEEGRLQESVNYYEEAIQIKPDYAEAHNNLGLALLYLQQAVEAEGHFREALRLDQNLPEIQGNIGISLVQQGKLTEAVDHFRKQVILSPDNPSSSFNLGLALYDAGNIDEARQYLRKAGQQGYPLPSDLQMFIRGAD